MSTISGINLESEKYNITLPLLDTFTTTTAGSSTSGSYLATKWAVANVNGITTPVNGMSVAIRVPLAGSSGGVLLSIDGGTTYYPIVRNVNTLVTTTYAVGSTIILTFNPTQTASPYVTAGTATTVTGCWQTADYDANTTYTNVKLGHGYATCSTAAGTAAKTASLTNYTLTTGGIVAVRFTNGNTVANPTLNITSKGAKAIYYNGAALTDTSLIKAGDVVTFMYSSQYHIIAINRYDDYAPIDSPVFTGSISMGRKANTTVGYRSVAVGDNVTASASYSYAEGVDTTASATESHAEGNTTTASGRGAHAEGYETVANKNYSHAEGTFSSATGVAAHSEGNGAIASGEASHSEGISTSAEGEGSHAEGGIRGMDGVSLTTLTIAASDYPDSLTSDVIVNGSKAVGIQSHAEGTQTYAHGYSSHSEGSKTKALGDYSHAEGGNTATLGRASHSEGLSTKTKGIASHAEGGLTEASGDYSHAEGYSTFATKNYAHSEGNMTYAMGSGSHSEGFNTYATGYGSHAEGYFAYANGDYSHAEGWNTYATGDCSHAQGKFNIEDSSGIYAHVVGNGEEYSRSNAHTLDWDGNAWFAGDVYVGSTSGTNKDTGSKKLATDDLVFEGGELLLKRLTGKTNVTYQNVGTMSYGTNSTNGIINIDFSKSISHRNTTAGQPLIFVVRFSAKQKLDAIRIKVDPAYPLSRVELREFPTGQVEGGSGGSSSSTEGNLIQTWVGESLHTEETNIINLALNTSVYLGTYMIKFYPVGAGVDILALELLGDGGLPYNGLMSAEDKRRLNEMQGVFIAEYGITTSAEIEAAYQAGKTVFCKDANLILTQMSRGGSAIHMFMGSNSPMSFICLVCQNNNWVNLSSDMMYTYSTTDLTAGSSTLATGRLYFVYE